MTVFKRAVLWCNIQVDSSDPGEKVEGHREVAKHIKIAMKKVKIAIQKLKRNIKNGAAI